jgi:hypothetical protein
MKKLIIAETLAVITTHNRGLPRPLLFVKRTILIVAGFFSTLLVASSSRLKAKIVEEIELRLRSEQRYPQRLLIHLTLLLMGLVSHPPPQALPGRG